MTIENKSLNEKNQQIKPLSNNHTILIARTSDGNIYTVWTTDTKTEKKSLLIASKKLNIEKIDGKFFYQHLTKEGEIIYTDVKGNNFKPSCPTCLSKGKKVCPVSLDDYTCGC